MPKTTASYKLVYLGNARFAATHSGTVTVTVKPFVKTPTVLSIAETKFTIKAGQTDTISGVLTARAKPLAGQRVWLKRYNAALKKWLPVVGEFTAKTGKVTFIVRPGASTSYMLVYLGSRTLAATHSGTVTVTVTK